MIIGLTGGIASGKSTVSRMLQKLGAVIVDADLIAREVVEPEQPTWYKLKERFGEEVFFADGRLDRKRLGAIIFQDGQARDDLNAIIHPAIRESMWKQRDEAKEAGVAIIVLDIPLLFESKLEDQVEKILVVYVPEEVQIKRLMARDHIDYETALQRIGSQITIEEKKNKGHAFIDNAGSLEQTEQQLREIIANWKAEEHG